MGLLAAGSCLAVALAAAPAALASTVTVSGNTIRVAESGNQKNRITVAYDAGANLYAGGRERSRGQRQGPAQRRQRAG
jgi:hypothetical protein